VAEAIFKLNCVKDTSRQQVPVSCNGKSQKHLADNKNRLAYLKAITVKHSVITELYEIKE